MLVNNPLIKNSTTRKKPGIKVRFYTFIPIKIERAGYRLINLKQILQYKIPSKSRLFNFIFH